MKGPKKRKNQQKLRCPPNKHLVRDILQNLTPSMVVKVVVVIVAVVTVVVVILSGDSDSGGCDSGDSDGASVTASDTGGCDSGASGVCASGGCDR